MTRDELIAAVPVRDHEGRPYFVALADIPDPWREQFSDALYGCQMPLFDGFNGCAYAWDWEVWVRGPEGLSP